MRRIHLVVLMLVAALWLSACGAQTQANAPATSSQAQAAPTTEAATSAAPTSAATAAGSAAATDTPTGGTPTGGTPATSPATAGALRLALQPDSQVSFSVREQLANRNLPSDAVGTTSAVTGTVALQADGKIVPEQSKFVVDMSTLKTDSGMRDNYIRRNTLQVSNYPQATFVPTAVEGLPSPLPASGDVSFKVTGDMTIHGVTKPVTWDVQGKIAGQDLTGTAKTSFKFEDFGMTPPSTMVVLSVVDNITLEATFHLAAQGS